MVLLQSPVGTLDIPGRAPAPCNAAGGQDYAGPGRVYVLAVDPGGDRDASGCCGHPRPTRRDVFYVLTLPSGKLSMVVRMDCLLSVVCSSITRIWPFGPLGPLETTGNQLGEFAARLSPDLIGVGKEFVLEGRWPNRQPSAATGLRPRQTF